MHVPGLAKNIQSQHGSTHSPQRTRKTLNLSWKKTYFWGLGHIFDIRLRIRHIWWFMDWGKNGKLNSCPPKYVIFTIKNEKIKSVKFHFGGRSIPISAKRSKFLYLSEYNCLPRIKLGMYYTRYHTRLLYYTRYSYR